MRSILVALAAGATALGLVDLYSADLGLDGTIGRGFSAQSTHAFVGLLAFALLSRVPVETLRRAALPAWLAGVVLLVATVSAGHIAGGARSWLVLGPARIQPAELMKVILPLALAAALGRPEHRRPEERALRRLLLRAGVNRHAVAGIAALFAQMLWVGVLAGIPVGLLLVQPDLGSAGLLCLGAACVVWLSGIPRILVAGAFALAAAAAPVGWLFLEDYQRARILTFLDPSRDPGGDGFQTLQSLFAVASGGPTGRGFLAGTQGRLGFLPEHTTDFILAHLSEEWGFLGATVALGLLFGLVAVGLVVAERARDGFKALLAAGLVAQIGVQVVVNVGGILGLLPLTGVTLPFFSYGGSSLVAAWAAVGVLAAIARTHERRRALALSPDRLVRPVEVR